MNDKELKEWRLRMGLSKSSASIALGMSRTTFTYYEMGDRNIPKYIALACSAIAHGLPPMGDKDSKTVAD